MKMIGKYSILGVDGEELSLNNFFNRRVAIIDDYRGKIGVSIVDDLISFKDDSTIIIHDLHGYFRVLKDDILRVYAGLDIKIPSFNLDEFDYFPVLTEILSTIMNIYGYKNNRWRIILSRGLEDALRRSEDTFKSLIRELKSLKEETSGLEKELYTEAVNIFRCIFSYDDIDHIDGDFEEHLPKKLEGKIIIDYTGIRNYIGRQFLMSIYHFEILWRDPEKYQLLPYADYLLHTNIVFNHFLTNSNQYRKGILFFSDFNKKIHDISDTILVNNQKMVNYLGYISYLPPEAIDSDYTVIDKDGISFLKVPYKQLNTSESLSEPIRLEGDYFSTYKDEITKILRHILEYGRTSMDGIVVSTGIDRRLAIALIDRLWRDGYIKRLVGRGGAVYRISVKGVKYLKGDET